jgi:hypothetical protein
MKRRYTGDIWADAKLLHAEEVAEATRAHAARRAQLRDARPPRRAARVWLGTLLLRVGRRLLDSVPGAAGPDPA